jgi:hypothetical protein
MISWKHSFDKISKDLELTRKKKQTLDNLFNTGKISQPTYDSLNTELSTAITETEARQKELAGQMSSKVAELEEQVSTLEMLLASSELQYVAGEIDDELHAHESKAFGLGLEATKQELNTIKNIIASIMQEPVQPQPQLETQEATEVEVPKTGEIITESQEAPAEAPVEEKTIEATIEAQHEAPTQVQTEAPTESATETVTETVVETKIEAPPETPMEMPKEETAPSEEMTIEVIKEVKEEQVISSEPIAEEIVEEALSVKVAEASPEEATFFRDPKETSEEKKLEEKEEPRG